MTPAPIHTYPAIVVMIGQDGCPHCEELKPRFHRMAYRYQHCVPAVAFDAYQVGPWCDAQRPRIDTTPTVVIMRYGRVVFRCGNVEDADLELLFLRAAGACEI